MWQWKVLRFIEKTKKYLFSFFSHNTVMSYYEEKQKYYRREIERLEKEIRNK